MDLPHPIERRPEHHRRAVGRHRRPEARDAGRVEERRGREPGRAVDAVGLPVAGGVDDEVRRRESRREGHQRGAEPGVRARPFESLEQRAGLGVEAAHDAGGGARAAGVERRADHHLRAERAVEAPEGRGREPEAAARKRRGAGQVLAKRPAADVEQIGAAGLGRRIAVARRRHQEIGPLADRRERRAEAVAVDGRRALNGAPERVVGTGDRGESEQRHDDESGDDGRIHATSWTCERARELARLSDSVQYADRAIASAAIECPTDWARGPEALDQPAPCQANHGAIAPCSRARRSTARAKAYAPASGFPTL